MNCSFADMMWDLSNVKGLGARGQKRQRSCFWQTRFLLITFELGKLVHNSATIVFLSSRRDKTYAWGLLVVRSIFDLKSRTREVGHMLTQVGHVAYQSIRRDKKSTMRPHHVSRSFQSWIIIRNHLVTSGDPRWPLWRLPTEICSYIINIINNSLTYIKSWWSNRAWCVYEGFGFSPIDL